MLFSKPPMYLLEACHFHNVLPEQYWLCYITVRICKHFLLLLNIYLVLCCEVYPHACTLTMKRGFLWKSTDTSIILIQFLSAVEDALWLCNGETEGGKGIGAEMEEGCSGCRVSHKFTSTSNLTQARGAWTGAWCFSNYCCSRGNSLA